MRHGEGIAGILVVFDGRCREAPAYDFRSVADDHEGLRVEFVDDFLDLGYFRQLDDGVDDPFVLHGVSSLAVEIGGAVADVAHEDLGDWRSPVGNDDDAFTLFEADDDLVGNEGCNVNGDEGQDGPFQGEEPGGRQEDDQIEEILADIATAIGTGKNGDGKVFVTEVLDAMRIRTNERGDDALM